MSGDRIYFDSGYGRFIIRPCRDGLRLTRDSVDSGVFPDIDAGLMEIAENIDRTDLTASELTAMRAGRAALLKRKYERDNLNSSAQCREIKKDKE
jgi:hypothetical protein